MFQLASDFAPAGDQPRAIDRLAELVQAGERHSVLLGITGSGKTFTLANLISRLQRPALVISPNKTLAAQLYSEFKSFFPQSAVEYFVSYYDYYQPEAYIPQSDTYIEKDALINDEIDRMRHSATTSLFERRDVVIVASVSCIYGIGEPETYRGMHVAVETGQTVSRDALVRDLVAIQYERNDYDFRRGTFRVRGDVVEVFPAAAESEALRIELFGDSVDRIVALPLLALRQREVHPVVALRRAEAVDARHRRDDHAVAALEQGPRGRHPEAVDLLVDRGLFLDVGVGRGDVGLGLVVVVVADEVLDGVLGKEALELLVELRGERLVMRHHERGPVDARNH